MLTWLIGGLIGCRNKGYREIGLVVALPCSCKVCHRSRLGADSGWQLLTVGAQACMMSPSAVVTSVFPITWGYLVMYQQSCFWHTMPERCLGSFIVSLNEGEWSPLQNGHCKTSPYAHLQACTLQNIRQLWEVKCSSLIDHPFLPWDCRVCFSSMEASLRLSELTGYHTGIFWFL